LEASTLLTLLLADDETKYQHRPGYYKECEKGVVALQLAQESSEAEGHIFLYPFMITCAPDGEYLQTPSPAVENTIPKLKIDHSYYILSRKEQ